MKTIKLICAAIVLALSLSAATEARASDIISYTYNKVGVNIYAPYASPNPYNYKRRVTAEDLGVPSLVDLTGLFVSEDYIFISSGAMIIITDHDFNTRRVITSVVIDGVETALTAIDGLFVTKSGELYACETGRNRVLHFDSDFNIKRVLGRPEGILLSESVVWQPKKIAVDNAGRIYIIAGNVYEGIVEINPDGSFNRYFGKVDVTYTPAELFWRSIQSRRQRTASKKWLPVNFTNLAVDPDDFIFATVGGEKENEPIRKLNAKGVNILRAPITLTGTLFPGGDIYYASIGQETPTGMSRITAIDVSDYGVYITLDTNRNRVFAYDDDGYLLYAFGAWGNTKGAFRNPVDIKFLGETGLIVADRGNRSIEVYELSDYGAAIHTAARLGYNSDYKAANEYWRKALDYNQNFLYAYVGIGKELYRDGDYKGAMEAFKMGQEPDYYSDAYKEVRKAVISDNFNIIVIVILLIAALYLLRKFVWKPRKAAMGNLNAKGGAGIFSNIKETFLTFPLYIIARPFKGFGELKYDKRGKPVFAVIILLMTGVVATLDIQFKGFVMTGYYSAFNDVNYYYVFFMGIIPVILFVLSNWSITTITGGIGKLHEILLVYCYALYPKLFLTIIGLILSNFVTVNESAFASFFYIFGTVAFAFYLFIGLITIHDYSFGRAVLMIIFTILAMAVIIFIFALLMSLTGEVGGFFEQLYLETRLRL